MVALHRLLHVACPRFEPVLLNQGGKHPATDTVHVTQLGAKAPKAIPIS